MYLRSHIKCYQAAGMRIPAIIHQIQIAALRRIIRFSVKVFQFMFFYTEWLGQFYRLFCVSVYCIFVRHFAF